MTEWEVFLLVVFLVLISYAGVEHRRKGRGKSHRHSLIVWAAEYGFYYMEALCTSIGKAMRRKTPR